VRINAAPTKGFEEMVGSKTAIRVLNMGLSRKIEELVTSGQVTRNIRTYNNVLTNTKPNSQTCIELFKASFFKSYTL
jgi:hypothetical protein